MDVSKLFAIHRPDAFLKILQVWVRSGLDVSPTIFVRRSPYDLLAAEPSVLYKHDLIPPLLPREKSSMTCQFKSWLEASHTHNQSPERQPKPIVVRTWWYGGQKFKLISQPHLMNQGMTAARLVEQHPQCQCDAHRLSSVPFVKSTAGLHQETKLMAEMFSESTHSEESNTRPIVRVQLLVQGEDGGDAADVVGEWLGFVTRQGAA